MIDSHAPKIEGAKRFGDILTAERAEVEDLAERTTALHHKKYEPWNGFQSQDISGLPVPLQGLRDWMIVESTSLTIELGSCR
jgi:hypothetical protein